MDSKDDIVRAYGEVTVVYKDTFLHAKKAVYNEDAVKETSNYFENKYFSKKRENSGNIYSLSEEIKSKVDFLCEDIINGHRNRWKYDIIFCRYLLIYINREARKGFLKILESRLNVGGLLFIGKTENILSSQSNLKLVDSLNRIYMKIR